MIQVPLVTLKNKSDVNQSGRLGQQFWIPLAVFTPGGFEVIPLSALRLCFQDVQEPPEK